MGGHRIIRDLRGQAPADRNGDTVLILGAGVSGITAATVLSQAGVHVHLAEKSDAIGGHAADMGCKATDTCVRCNVCVADELRRGLPDLPNVQLHTNTELLALAPDGNGKRFDACLAHRAPEPGAPPTSNVGVDAIVIAIGHEPYNPGQNSNYGYGRLRNVISGPEAELQLARSGRLVRPSDNAVPRRIAFVQCVGSRTEEVYRRPEDTDYCSTVCCAYALRIARLLKHQASDSEITVFYMDVQNFGKQFNTFFAQSKAEMQFVRSRPYEITPASEDGATVVYAPDGSGALSRESFDLVVLATGIRPPADAVTLAARLGVPIDEQGFFGIKGASCLPDLQREGMYVAGTSESPKDIAASMAQAEAVSAAVLESLRPGHADAKVRPSATNNHVATAEPAGSESRHVLQEVAVVGSGIAAMRAALSLTRLGHPVILISERETLGGAAAAMPELYSYLRSDPEEAAQHLARTLRDLADGVSAEPHIRVLAPARITAVQGELGDFTLSVRMHDAVEPVQAGAIVLAIGANLTPAPADSDAESACVVSMTALLDRMRRASVPRRVAFLLDMHREQERAVAAQVFSAAETLAPDAQQVAVYCRHVRVNATGLEALYRRARGAGVIVTKWTQPPTIAPLDGTIRVTAHDSIANADVAQDFDLLVLADLVPRGNGDRLSPFTGLRAGPDETVQADNVWLLPTLTNRPGVFTVGAARGNSEFRQALTDSFAVAATIHNLLGDGRITVRDDAATVDTEKCVACLTCLRICPHGAIRFDPEEGAATISPVSCRRCGICAAECPSTAITLPGFTDEQVQAEVGAQPRITVFACENSAVPAADAAAEAGLEAPANAHLVHVPCAGKVDPRMVLAALEKGAERVLILGCHPESCQYLSGSSRAAKRMARLVNTLEQAGIDAARVAFRGIASVQPHRFVEQVREVANDCCGTETH